MLVDLSRINESWYLAWHLSIYQAIGKLNDKFCFNQWWVSPIWNLCTRIPKHTKKILWSSSYAQRDSLILGATVTFYAPRLLKNIAKGYINQMIDVVLATDCRFVQRISLRALATGISNAKSLAFGTPNTKNKIYEMSQMLKNLPL